MDPPPADMISDHGDQVHEFIRDERYVVVYAPRQTGKAVGTRAKPGHSDPNRLSPTPIHPH